MVRRGTRNADKEKYWRSAILRWQSSGLGPRAFCQQEKIDEGLFFSWRSEIRRRDLEGLPKGRSARDEKAGQEPKFVPVTIAEVQPTVRSGRMLPGGIEIQTPGGVLIKIQARVDYTDLREVLAAIKESQC